MKKTTASFSTTQIIMISLVIMAGVVEYSFNVVLARLLSPEDYGDISVALTIMLFSSIVAELGATKVIQKYLPRYYEQKKLHLIKGLLIFYSVVPITIAFAIALISVVMTYIDFYYLHNYATHITIGWEYLYKSATEQYHPLLLALWIVPLVVLSSILSAVLKSLDRYVLSVLPNLVLLYCLAICIFGIAYCLHIHLTDWNLLALFGLAYFFICLLQGGAAYYYLPRSIIHFKAHYHMPRWMRLSLPMMMSTLFFIGLKQTGLLMVEWLTPEENAVGYFAAAQKVSGIILIFYLGMNIVYVPLASRVLLQGKAAIQQFIGHTTREIIYVCLPMFILIVFLGKVALGWFGADYEMVYWPMCILAFTHITSALTGYPLVLLQYAHQQNKILLIQLLFLVVNIILGWLFIPNWGVMGAALATAMTIISMNIITGVMAYRRFLSH